MATLRQWIEYRKMQAEVIKELDAEVDEAFEATMRAIRAAEEDPSKDTVGMFEDEEDDDE